VTLKEGPWVTCTSIIVVTSAKLFPNPNTNGKDTDKNSYQLVLYSIVKSNITCKLSWLVGGIAEPNKENGCVVGVGGSLRVPLKQELSPSMNKYTLKNPLNWKTFATEYLVC